MTQTLEIQGRQYVLLPLEEFEQLCRAAGRDELPQLPARFSDGTRPAAETVRVLLAQRIVKARNAAGISQAEMARLAGMQVATLNRIERAKVMPDAKTVAKIEKALKKKGQRV
ncbi:MAG TPA: helix-turn-helix transcriptional regulator [Tepidisphaeraceae bacterium]|nr:helix-turn-helix transcriptional regulator [Tepidisphaeraceae bacterium]